MDTRTQHLPRFAARLRFPQAENRPHVATLLDDGGRFGFTKLDAGRCPLEVYRGEGMIRGEVAAEGAPRGRQQEA